MSVLDEYNGNRKSALEEAYDKIARLTAQLEAKTARVDELRMMCNGLASDNDNWENLRNTEKHRAEAAKAKVKALEGALRHIFLNHKQWSRRLECMTCKNYSDKGDCEYVVRCYDAVSDWQFDYDRFAAPDAPAPTEDKPQEIRRELTVKIKQRRLPIPTCCDKCGACDREDKL